MNLLASYPFFFDSPEYVSLSRLPLLEALKLVHPLAHPISTMMWRATYLLFGSSVALLSLVSLITWVIGVVVASRCISKQRRWVMYVVCLFLPLPWLVMTNVLVDSLSTSLFVIGVASIWSQRNLGRVAFATLFFCLAIFNYLGMMVWLAIPLFIIWSDKNLAIKQKLLRIIVVGASSALAVGVMWMLGLLNSRVGVGMSSLPVAIYHAGVAFVANYTWVSVGVVLGFGVYWSVIKDWRHLSIMMGLAALYVISLMPWHSGPYGRLGLFIVFPLAYLYSRLPRWVLVVFVGSVF